MKAALRGGLRRCVAGARRWTGAAGVGARASGRAPPLPHRALRRLAPELLEAVEVARVRGEDVDDHVEVVHQDPARLREALDAAREEPVVLLEPFGDAVGDRLGLPVRVARADDEAIGVVE